MDEIIECLQCGTQNRSDAVNCRMCGAHLKHTYETVGGVLVCKTCGARNPDGAELCSSCRTPFRKLVESNLPSDIPAEACVHWSDEPSSAGRAARVLMAGILILMAGVLGVVQSVLSLSPGLGDDILTAYEDLVPGASATDAILDEYVLLQAAVFVFGAIAIFGSIFALSQSRFDMSVVGGAAGVLAIGFIMGAFLSLVALLLLVTARRAFDPECG